MELDSSVRSDVRRMAFQMVELKRGGAGYLVQNYLFRKDKVKDGVLYLKCIDVRRTYCNARAKLSNGNIDITNGEHNHEAPDVVDYLFRASVKAEATRNGNARVTVPQVFENARRDILATVPPDEREDAAVRLPTFRTLRGSIEHARAALLPPNPASREDIDLERFRPQLRNEDGSSFLLSDSGVGDPSRIFVFGSARNLQILSKSREWYIDGTFWTVPLLFAQLFTIHCFFLGKQFPIIYALLPDKSQVTYERLLRMLLMEFINRGLYYGMFGLEVVTSDFEAALLSAVRNVFPHVRHRGCYFHFAQCIHRKIQELGMSVRYRNDQEFKKNCRMLISIAFVPAENKARFLDSLAVRCAGDLDFQRLLRVYFVPTWFGIYRLTSWTWHMDEIRTNNNIEAWHRRFNHFVKQAHLSLYKFVLAMKEENCKCEIALSQRQQGEPLARRNATYVQLNNRIMKIMSEYGVRCADPIEHYLLPLSYCVPAPAWAIRAN